MLKQLRVSYLFHLYHQDKQRVSVRLSELGESGRISRACDGSSALQQGPALQSTLMLAAVMSLPDPCWLEA